MKFKGPLKYAYAALAVIVAMVIIVCAFLVIGTQKAHAQSGASLWKLSGVNLSPVNATWNLKIPGLNTTGAKRCVNVLSTGVLEVAAAECGTGGSGSGDVVGPASATDNAVARYDSTTGKLIQGSDLIVDDSENITGIASLHLAADGAISFGGVNIISDVGAGVIGLNNIGSITSGTETTFEAALDIAGDVTGTGLTAVAITNDAVTNAKLRNSGANSVIGRSAGSTGDPADITASSDGHVLYLSGTTLGFGTIGGSSITNGGIAYADIQDVSATNRLLGRATAGSGAIEEITVGGDITQSGSTFTIGANTVALTTDTTGDYVSSATASGGLTLTGTEGGSLGILLPAATNGLSATTSSGSGLELLSGGLALLQGCADTEILKWNETTDLWACAADGGSGGIPTQITVANEGADTSSFVSFFTSATGDLEPKTNANLTFNAASGLLSVGRLTVSSDNFTVGASLPFADTTGTLTLQNVDVIEATTEATIEAAIDTLANLTSIQGQAMSFAAPLTIPADPNADRFLFWDDSAGATAWLTPGNGVTITTTTVAVDSASDTVDGIVELATTAETNTGTDATRAVTPDGLAGSVHGVKNLDFYILDAAYLITTGDGKAYSRIPSEYNGMNIVSVSCAVHTTSSSGTPTVQLSRGRQSSATTAHSYVDVLSTRVTIDATEYDSKDASAAAVINASNDDVATGDMFRWDVDVIGTGTKGLNCNVGLQLP